MDDFALVRVGKDDPDAALELDSIEGSTGSVEIVVVCKQVPSSVGEGTTVFVWLGSDNDKGTPTAWKQGVRAVGEVILKEGGESYQDECVLTLNLRVFLRSSMDKMDMLRVSPSAYYWIAKMPIVGISAFSNQTVQVIKNDSATQDIRALLYLFGQFDERFRESFSSQFPSHAGLLDYFPPDPTGDGEKEKPDTLPLDNDDPLLRSVEELIEAGHRSFLFLGPPGTGKTYFAHRVAASIVESPEDQVEVVQFHQSFSYDDFVEGYIPTPASSESSRSPFTLKPKVFRRICERAQDNPDKLYVLVIDELNRGDSSRIFGELLTYIEDAYREKKFTLAYSGIEFAVPKNLVVLATMNPFDHSVADLDAALDRRFSKFSFDPDRAVISEHLNEAGCSEAFSEAVLSLFDDLQKFAPYGGLGHAFFLNVSDVPSLRRVWSHQLKFLFQRIFWDDETSLLQVSKRFSEAVQNAEEVEEGIG